MVICYLLAGDVYQVYSQMLTSLNILSPNTSVSTTRQWPVLSRRTLE